MNMVKYVTFIILLIFIIPVIPSGCSENATEGKLFDMQVNGLMLPSIFSDHMVLQQKADILIWGLCKEGDRITVDFNGRTYKARVKNNNWDVTMKTVPAGGPYQIVIRGDEDKIVLEDILVGEVWVCAGQSNMAHALTYSLNADAEIAASNDPKLRLFFQELAGSDEPDFDVSGGIWRVSGPECSADFTATGYHFGKELRSKLGVPVGLISTAIGSTQIQDWMSRKSLEKDERFLSTYFNDKRDFVKPFHLYNKRIAPLMPFVIKGVIWYQGESNARKPDLYYDMFCEMIGDWRKNWGQGDFPFIFVQLAGFENLLLDEGWAIIREAQLNTFMNIKNAHMISAVDIGEKNNIHPINKPEVGRRLALAARAAAYSEDLEYSGPVAKGAVLNGERVRISFAYALSGLAVKDGLLKGFQICGEDGTFKEASAEITGHNSIEVWNVEISNPKQVRYAWGSFPDISLFDNNGLPASPFRIEAR